MAKLAAQVRRPGQRPAASVTDRMRRSAQGWVDRARLAAGHLPGGVLPDALEPVTVPFFFDSTRVEVIRSEWTESFPEDLARLRSEAEELAAGRAVLLDRSISWTDNPCWHVDPLTGDEWPCRFWTEMRVQEAGARHIWELGRHQLLTILARGAFLTGDLRFSDAAFRWLRNWIDENPPYTGIHWTRPYEIALRLVNWCWIYGFLRPFPLPPDLEQEFFRSIQLQVEFLRRFHPGSPPSRPRAAEASAAAMAGLTFPWLANAEQWRDWGIALLARELMRSVTPDGADRGRSLQQYAFLLDLGLQPVLLCRHGSREIPVELLDGLEQMADLIYSVTDAAGGVPDVGEAGDTIVVPLGQDPSRPYRSLLASCGVLFNRAEFCRAAGRFDVKSAWLLGPGGRERFDWLIHRDLSGMETRGRGAAGPPDAGLSLSPGHRVSVSPHPPLQTRRSRSFSEAGYTVIRSGTEGSEQLLLLRHGPPDALPEQGPHHADCLSLALHIGGQPVLLDPGAPGPQEEPEYRRYLRGASAHNSVTIAGEPQAGLPGQARTGRRTRCTLSRWVTQPWFDYLEAERDGYTRLPGRPVHRRSVFHRRDGATFVIDHVVGDGTHDAGLTWHFPAGCSVEALDFANLTGAGGCSAWLAHGDGFRIQLAILNEQTPETEIVEGQKEPLQGWVTSESGALQPAPVLCSRLRGPLPLVWATILVPGCLHVSFDAEHNRHASASAPYLPVAVSGQVDARGVAVTLTSPGGCEVYVQSFQPDCWLELDGGRFRGHAAHLRFDTAGRLLNLCAAAGLELEWQGRTLWQSTGGFEDIYLGH